MLRVLRLSSPMSVGSWVLTLATPLSAGSALLTMSRGPLWYLGYGAGIGVAGVLGMPLATYTAVLLSNSAVPVWLATRKSLPFLFGAILGGVARPRSLDLMPLDERERTIVKRFGIAGTHRGADRPANSWRWMPMPIARSDGRFTRLSRVCSGKRPRSWTVSSLVLTPHARKERRPAPDGGNMRHSGQHGPTIRHLPRR